MENLPPAPPPDRVTLPVGVIIPTKNSLPYLARHVAGLRPWLDLASEVVVVDSFSTDGTVDYLRDNLKHPALRFTSHPPGLYASWNHGVAQISSKYVYIATAGDTITRAGVSQLVATAESLACDVVISRPSFCDMSGRAMPDKPWPADDVIATLDVREPRRLRPVEAVILAAVHATNALTGSCASDLFRTEILQRHPFPTEFGYSGDSAWSWLHVAEVTYGIVPDRFSTFALHPTTASGAEKQSLLAARRADAVLREAMDSWRRVGVVDEQILPRALWEDLMTWLTTYFDAKAAFDEDRRHSLPWVLNPRAWGNRSRRERASRKLHQLKRAALLGGRAQTA
jgi:glycosyltransferase involved in cell wall biosynthesis